MMIIINVIIKINRTKEIILPQYCNDTKDGWWWTCLNGCNGQMEAVHIADCQCYHPNLPGWRTNMDPSGDTWTRTQRSLGPVLYQQLWCSSSSHCEQENRWRQPHRLAYVLCLIKKWRWPIKIVLAYTFFKTWYRYQENKAERNASIIATGKKMVPFEVFRSKRNDFHGDTVFRRNNHGKKIGR